MTSGVNSFHGIVIPFFHLISIQLGSIVFEIYSLSIELKGGRSERG